MMEKNAAKRFATILLTAALCLQAVSATAQAVTGEQDDSYTVTATYDVSTTHTLGTWELEYSDSCFMMPASQYNHQLARLSLGMAVSAFRPNLDPAGAENPAVHLLDFMDQCGFSELRTDDYDKNPSL